MAEPTFHAHTGAALRSRLPYPYRPEIPVVETLLSSLEGELNWSEVQDMARPWVQAVRDNPPPFWAMESLLREYPISTQEGLALMRLAEALLRVPDAETAIALTADQLGRAAFDGSRDGPHRMMANLSASAISLSRKFLPEDESGGGLIQRLGAHTVVAATVRAIQLMGRQFVLGRHIGEAMSEAAAARREQPMLRFSYDMLGEGARTEEDAERYHASYLNGIAALAGQPAGGDPTQCDGISIKLSALFSRYEEAQRDRVLAVLLPRVWSLVARAAEAGINLTVDAEEVDRLELHLDLMDALLADVARHYPQWRGLGLALQSYQTRAAELIESVAALARHHGVRMMVRLVKGAYWDGEVKRAQEQGLPHYPVFTHKRHTDIAYLACARAMLDHADVLYSQFASHNAGTVAAIVIMARKRNAKFEMQRLHGMGDGIYREVMRANALPLRVYAPVGEHRDLLAYLVRRLLENGANSSFVHQLADDSVAIDDVLASPLYAAQAPALEVPHKIYEAEGLNRANSDGADLAVHEVREPLFDVARQMQVPAVADTSLSQVDGIMAALAGAAPAWGTRPAADRVLALRKSADLLQERLPHYCALLVREAHKTMGDAISEVREAIDFLRYYAGQVEKGETALAPSGMPWQEQDRAPGVFVCISPWNFPLAIFAGQVAAALVSGHAVAAKPAEQTPAVAQAMVDLMHEAGVPQQVLQIVVGAGDVGAALVSHPLTAGVCFTGSTAVAQHIQRALAAKPGPLAPLIAETGGINAMIVDSTALPEQVVDAVVQSAFRSAGQRCSALRLLCVHEDIAEGMIHMIRGALKELRVGDPVKFATDVGPLIDDEAFQNIRHAVQRLRASARWIGESSSTGEVPRLLCPVAFEVPSISAAQAEIFGPVLQIVRWRGDVDAVIQQVNALGFGLTMGIQTRIDSRAARLARKACIGNVYINRNMIGAVVGVQPFGGEGMSGTGPKAGGPLYLNRFLEARAPSALAALADGEGQKTAPAAGLSEAVADDGVKDLLQRLTQAWGGWRRQESAERLSLLERARLGWGRMELPVMKTVKALLPSRAMPGPTGESNEWRIQGRGVWVIAPSAHEEYQWDAALAALALGNTVLLCCEHDEAMHESAQQLRQILLGEGLPASALLITQSTLAVVLASVAAMGRAADHVVGVCATLPQAVEHSEQGKALRHQLADLPNALRLWVPAPNAQGQMPVYRLAAEQTVTINTAAAGGNAALLTSMGQH